MLDLRDRTAMIAGTRRIGATVARRLAAEGVRLALVYRHSEVEVTALARDLGTTAEEPLLLRADLSIEDDVRRVVDEAATRLGGLSIGVTLASDFRRTPLDALDAEGWDRGLAAARATFLFALHASRAMRRNAGPTRGHLVFFGDWAALGTPYPDYLPYLTAKAAIDFLTRGFALELAPHGILVNAISPGPSETRPPTVTEAEWREALRDAPLHRVSSSEDMAEVIVALLRSETVTGENVRVDSGRHLAGAGPADRGA